MKPLPRDLLLKRIQMLEHQYSDLMVAMPNSESMRHRFDAAADRVRARAGADDLAFVDASLRNAMAFIGLIPGNPPRCPAPRASKRVAVAASEDPGRPTYRSP